MSKSTSLTIESDLIARLRRVLSTSVTDSARFSQLEGALARFTSLEFRRNRRKALADAREQKDWIIARLAFLAELDELTERESDLSVFEEVALQFDEIGVAAAEAAISIRSIAGFPYEARRGRHH